MSSEDDAESRTEEASEKKILDALEKGNNPVSRDAIILTGFVAFLLSISFVFDATAERLFGTLKLMFANSGVIPVRNGADANSVIVYVMREVGLFLWPVVLLFMIGGLVAAFAQNAPRVVFDRILPELSRLSPSKSFARIFGKTGLVELLKSTVKISIVSGSAALTFSSQNSRLRDLMHVELSAIPRLLLQSVAHLAETVVAAATLLALADIAWTRFKWRRDLRMSRQDLKDELKEAEGDPHVKARLRSLFLSRSRKRMMASVPKATMVIANPTHYAIALRYVREEGGAPLVLAKGKDLMALKIREIAEEKSIPVVEKKELVRAMYDHVDVNKMIPPEFFRSVAEIIHFLSAHGQQRRHIF